MKNLLNSVMLFLLLFIGQNAWGQDATEVASGDLNSDIHWSVSSTDGNQTYTLTITGTGDMPDYTSSGTPWGKAIGGASENSKINVVNIDSRITKIGDYSFMGVNITSVDIPTSCTSIGSRAFFYCSNLKEIYIPSSVTSLNSHAFDGCGNLSLIHYDGRCTENTKLYIYDLPATGKIIEKEGTGNTCFQVPSGWEYYTHGVQCNGGAWVAENADQTKLFFYAQNPGATVNYAGRKASGTSTNDERYHPWRVNCMNYTSLEINKILLFERYNAFLTTSLLMVQWSRNHSMYL